MSRFVEAEAGIRQLHAHYTDAVWRKDAIAFGECFAKDAEWRISGMIFRGRDDITESIRRILSNANRILMTFRTPIVELTESGASARTYVTEQCTWTHGRDPNISIGRYYEDFVEEGGRWLFAWRVFELHYSGPEDMTGTFHEHPDYGPPPAMPPRDRLPENHAAAKWGLNPDDPLGKG